MSVVELEDLPVGAGQGRFDQGDGHVDEGEGPAAAIAQLPPLEVTPPAAPEPPVEWKTKTLKKPLQILVGRTVNNRIRARLQIETQAGLMSDEQATNIAEPGAEILNRYEPTRALAARGVEMNLMIAIYDYVQETAVRAGQDAHRAQQLAQRPPRPVEEFHPAPPPTPFTDMEDQL